MTLGPYGCVVGTMEALHEVDSCDQAEVQLKMINNANDGDT